ncbi:MAG TPA: radical SAM family heme chaperone HemW [Dissulfurispiraceae bacterium]|nr:radical SAM family heme chaperone HemW [Dissulfurispiraceae bacterium]
MARYLYVHIPFCLSKCIYCDFYSVPKDDLLIDQYMKALCKEMEMREGHATALEGIYIGGGTPSVLKEAHTDMLMAQVKTVFGIAKCAEITSEANPGTLTERGVAGILKAGINRISLGVQSLDNNDLSLLGRTHNSAEALTAISVARSGGFDNLSIDLIYGIPGQHINSWKRTLEDAVSLSPEHVSAYELTPEKNTPLYAELKAGRLCLPDEDAVAEMYYSAIDLLEDNRYRHYEISNFARPGYECRHNLNYWNRGQYLGVGAGAHSFLAGCRKANVGDVGQYIATILEGGIPVIEEKLLTGQDELEEFLFLGLRKREGIDIDRLPQWAAEKVREALDELVIEGLLEYTSNRIRLTRRGLIICNAVIVRLMLCIEQHRPV